MTYSRMRDYYVEETHIWERHYWNKCEVKSHIMDGLNKKVKYHISEDKTYKHKP